MVTKLQDISNKVAQSKISNARLRNEEIRRQMALPWSEPTMPKEQYTPTQSNINPSQSNTLSGMFGSESDRATSTNTSSVGSMPDSLAGALPGLGSMAAGRAGLGAMSPAVGGAISGALGDWGGAIKGGATGLAAALGAGRHAGLVGTLAKDVFNDVPVDRMVANLGWNGLMTAVSTANPAVAGVVGLSSLFGFDVKDFIGQITGIESMRNEAYHKEKDFWSTIEQKMAMEDNPIPMDTVELGLPITTNDDPQDLGSLFGDDFGGFAVDNSIGLGGLFGGDYGDTTGNVGADLGAFGLDSGFNGFGEGTGPDAPDGPSSESADAGREGGTDGM